MISANRREGVLIQESDDPTESRDNEIANNFIGTDLSGTANFGNAAGGVHLDGVRNRVDRNVIAFNSELVGDTGVAVSGNANTGNLITANSMFSNDGLGINLIGGTEDGNGVTLNDAGDVDTGPNDLLNFPILEKAVISSGNLTISGFAPPGSIIEFFVAAADPSGFGEGQTFLTALDEGRGDDLDATTGTYGPGPINGLQQGTDTTNRFRFTIPTPAGVALGTLLTATATDEFNSTSEFSGNVTVTGESADFGDAPDTYSTTLAANGPRHTQTGPILGTNRDGEPDGLPSTGADGDDLSGEPDDEDGVTLGDLTQGANANVTVVSSSNFAELDAFVDFNRDGDFADQGEKIFSSRSLNSGNNILSFSVPAAAVVGDTFARFRISVEGGLSFDGAAADGEVEDYAVRIVAPAPTFDFGDAPETYHTTVSANGPRHRLGSGLFFGTNAATDVDSELDGQPSAFADADETNGQFDERGISGQASSFAPVAITPGTTATAFVTASTAGFLDAFLDFNDDGDFADSGEQIFSGRSVVAGVNNLSFNVPAAATGGADNVTFSRWRISSQGELSFTGQALDGEVEDHSIDVVAPTACSLIVTTTNDAVSTTDGVNSLREAILCSNNTAGKDTITFNIPTTGPATISPQTGAPHDHGPGHHRRTQSTRCELWLDGSIAARRIERQSNWSGRERLNGHRRGHDNSRAGH